MGAHSFQVLDAGGVPTDETMRQLRRLSASAVTVVTFTSDQGFRGVTVSAYCVVSLTPARVLICLASQGEALATIQAIRRFAVNVLSDTQEFLADQFAGRAPLVNPRFEGVKYRLSRSGNPILEDCLTWFDCSVQVTLDAGDHTVVVGDIREAGRGAGAMPLLYFDGSYRELQLE